MTIPTEMGLPALEGLAYSHAPPTETALAPAAAPAPGRYPWHWVSARAALLVVFAALLAGGIIDLGYPRAQPAAPAQSPSTAAPTPPEAPTIPWEAPPAMPPDAPHKLAGDAWFLSMVTNGLAPIDMSVKDPAGIVGDGHNVCNYMAAGHSEAETVDEVVAGLPPTIKPAKARALAGVVVTAAVMAYGPEERR